MIKKFSNNSSSGFTLIELLVVIAIVGILSAVVLSQLNSARSKGADAAVKSNLSNMRGPAEASYDVATGSNGFNQVCTVGAGMRAAALAAGGNGETCAAAVGYWVAWAGLKTDLTKAWCVDSAGNSKQINKPVSAITVCP